MKLVRILRPGEIAPPLPAAAPSQRGPFTAAEDARIVAAYPRTTLRAIAAELGRPWQVVQGRVNILIREGRLTRRQRFWQPPWTDEDDELLAEQWGRLTDAAVARNLGRSVNACKIRATRRLRLARKDQFYVSRTVALLFGVDDHLVVRWIRDGHLVARRSTVRAGSAGYAWRIEEEAIARFLRRYPYAVERRRVEAGSYWRNLLDREWARDPWLTADGAAGELGVSQETVRRHLRRGWLAGERWPCAGKHGEWWLRQSALVEFRARHPIRLVLGSCADANRRKVS